MIGLTTSPAPTAEECSVKPVQYQIEFKGGTHSRSRQWPVPRAPVYLTHWHRVTGRWFLLLKHVPRAR